MCGIVGVTLNGIGSVKQDLLIPLKRLEYRGYDSCGFALSNGIVKKDVGKISAFIDAVEDEHFRSGICHTRWATHGGKTRANAHPHHNTAQTIFAVHNGIIENYQEIKNMLEGCGYAFTSNTDTEVIPHYFDWYLKTVPDMKIGNVIQKFMHEVIGTYAVLLTMKGDNRLYAFKKDSPLVLGIAEDRHVVASDIYSFSDITTQAIFFDDMEYAAICANSFDFYNQNGECVRKVVTEVERTEESTMEDYPYFMIKEINEQPAVTRRLIRSLSTDQNTAAAKLASLIDTTKRTVFVACGTSYHASLVGGSVLSKMGYEIHNIIASEFDTFYRVDSDTLVVAISQSGETMDVVSVIKEAKAKGAKIASLVNVPFSTIQRESEVSLNIVAGQEVAVASTKAFTNQVIALLSVSKILGVEIELDKIPEEIENTIRTNDAMAQQLAKEFKAQEHVFFLGRGLSYPVAREMALKMKEISYIHAEGMMAGELKHGSIALIDPDAHTPVINLIANDDLHMLSSAKEVEARGARVITVTNTDKGDFSLPHSTDACFALYSVIVGQLLSYYTAIERGCDVDQPRNLAKSVTVH